MIFDEFANEMPDDSMRVVPEMLESFFKIKFDSFFTISFDKFCSTELNSFLLPNEDPSAITLPCIGS